MLLSLAFVALASPLALSQDLQPGELVLSAARPSGTRGLLWICDADGHLRETLALEVLGGLYPHFAPALEYSPDLGLLVPTFCGDFGQDGELFTYARDAAHAHRSRGSIFDFGVAEAGALARDAFGRTYLAEGSFQASGCCPYTMPLVQLTPALEVRATFQLEVGDLPLGIRALAVRPDGGVAFYSTGDDVRRFDLVNGIVLPTFDVPEPVHDLALLPAADELLVAVQGPRVRRLDSGGNTLATYEFPGATTLELAVDAPSASFWVVTRHQAPPHVLAATGHPFRHVLQRVDIATGVVLARRPLPPGFIGDLTRIDGEKLRAR